MDHSNEKYFWETLREMSCTEEQHRPCPDDHLRMQLLLNGELSFAEWKIISWIFMREPEQVLAPNDQLLERHLKTWKTHVSTFNGIVDIVRFRWWPRNEQQHVHVPGKYRTLFKPYHTKINEYVHKHSSMIDIPPLLRFHLPGHRRSGRSRLRYP